MEYSSALDFLRNVGKKLHLQILTLSQGQSDAPRIDFGLRDFLSMQDRYDALLRDKIFRAHPNTIYRMTDEFLCSYLYLLLPGEPRPTVLIAGPYIPFEIRHDEFLKEAQRRGVPPWLNSRMEKFFLNLPIIQDTTNLLNIITAFGETIWGSSDNFQIVDVDYDVHFPVCQAFPLPDETSHENLLLDMQIMEKRYSSENELMRIISHGQVHRAERLSHAFVPSALEARSSDPVRNIKNYCIIGNTLMRKAAEHGGVHPVYLDATSSDFAKRIEQISTLCAGQDMFADMVRTYCRLVQKHTAQHYSPLVEQAILLIEADLSQDLSLSALADALRISAGYLSTLFRQETGKTVTVFVNEKRMEHAAHLLQSSTLQVQTVAQYCGIIDVNYFSKLFKRYCGVTPREYRQKHTK